MRTRKEERLATSISALVSVPGSDLQATILDISTTGCRIRAETEHADVGTTVVIEVAGEEVASGEIAWRSEEDAGVKFHRELAVEMVDRIAAVL